MAARERIVIADGPADTARIAAFERDRRELIRRGLAFGGALVAASSIPLLLSVRDAFAAESGDAEILGWAIHLEQVAVLAYDGAIGGGLLSARSEAVFTRFREHEQQHADALTTALTDLGGTPPQMATQEDVEGVGDLKTQVDVARFAIEFETAAVAAYLDAQKKLVDGKLLQSTASIMANEAQHLVVLRELARTDPVPSAFETGEK
jgi:rubrerythrin